VVDVALVGGRVAKVGLPGTVSDLGAETLDLDGYVVLPSLVEPHAHLDKAFTADRVINRDGSLRGAIEAWLPARVGFDCADIAARAWAVTGCYLACGTTAIRAHIDTGEGIGLRAIEALLAVRAALGGGGGGGAGVGGAGVGGAGVGGAGGSGVLDLQIVACCSRPTTGVAGADNRALLADALAAGCDLVGGAPAIDEHPSAAIDLLAAAAADAGVGMDLHIDETLDPSVTTIDHLIEVVRAGFPGPVTASHVVSLGVQPPARQQATAEALAATGIGVVTLPQTNLFLQGRGQGSAAPRGMTAVRRLMDAGVTVAAGGDNLQDPFNLMGRADPLETASLLVVAGHLLPPEAFAAVTSVSRRLMGLPAVAVEVGSPADFLAIRAATVRQAMAGASPERVVLRAGRVVSRTTVAVQSALGAAPRWAHR